MARINDRNTFAERVAETAATRAQFYVRTQGTTPLIEVAGEIDLSNVDALAGCLSVFEVGDRIILDLSRLTYIDSRGVAALVHTQRRGVDVVCRGVHGPVRTVVNTCGLDQVLTIEADGS